MDPLHCALEILPGQGNNYNIPKCGLSLERTPCPPDLASKIMEDLVASCLEENINHHCLLHGQLLPFSSTLCHHYPRPLVYFAAGSMPLAERILMVHVRGSKPLVINPLEPILTALATRFLLLR